jgi:cell wall-associated NlpC family hydrolase
LRVARNLVRALLVGAVSVGIVLPATVSSAAPSPGDLQRQIDVASANLEKIVEQYNKVTEDLKATQASQAVLGAQLKPLQDKMDAAYASVADLAAQAYKGAPLGTGAALLQAGSPGGLIDQLSMLDQLGRQHRSEIDGYELAKSKYAAQKQQLDNVLAAQTAMQKELVARKAKINSDLKALYALRTQAYGAPTEPRGTSYTGTIPAIAGSAGVAVAYAYHAIGKPYIWGAAGPDGYDCSGLTMAAWAAAGHSLPHNAAEQWSRVAHISRSQLQPGDLVFYESLGHVGIYVGSNQIIHAPHAGTNVQLSSVDIMTPYGYGRVR